MPELNEYHLRRWSLFVRLRDDFTCCICGKRCKKYTQAHHIYAKHYHPEKAYELSNGSTVCAPEHHQSLIHIRPGESYLLWTDFFKRQNNWKHNRDFNEEHQYKVRRIR